MYIRHPPSSRHIKDSILIERGVFLRSSLVRFLYAELSSAVTNQIIHITNKLDERGKESETESSHQGYALNGVLFFFLWFLFG